jgi:hypothetical protein
MLVLNFAISWMNARSAGRIWSESMAVGGALRFHAMAAYALAVMGFTMVYGIILVMLMPAVLPMLMDINPEALWSTTRLANDMLFILIALFILPLGYYAWFTSFVAFWRRRGLANGLSLGWNTYANLRNTITIARHAPSAVRRISDALFRGRRQGKGAIVAVALFVIIMAIIGGWLTASAIMRRADESCDFFEGMHCHDDPEWQRVRG